MWKKRRKAQAHSVSTKDSNRHYGHPSMHGLYILACVTVVMLGSYYIVTQNKATPPIRQIGKNEQNSLTKVKATGKVQEVTEEYMLITLQNGIVRQVQFDTSTQISTPTGSQNLDDIKPGSEVVLFTKRVAGQDVATRIIVQYIP